MDVNARVRDCRLRIIKDACPNLLREAALYRYFDRRAENLVDEHNDALAALHYPGRRSTARLLHHLLRQRRQAPSALGLQSHSDVEPFLDIEEAIRRSRQTRELSRELVAESRELRARLCAATRRFRQQCTTHAGEMLARAHRQL
jgi:hypothetical protein